MLNCDDTFIARFLWGLAIGGGVGVGWTAGVWAFGIVRGAIASMTHAGRGRKD